MTQTILLCADEASIRYPEMLGLEGEALLEQSWLKVMSSAEEARRFWQSAPHACEVWVASSDDIDAINVAAACKADRPDASVYLVSFSSSGSCRTRAERAQIDSVLDQHAFVARYIQAKRHFSIIDSQSGRISMRAERIPGPAAHLAGSQNDGLAWDADADQQVCFAGFEPMRHRNQPGGVGASDESAPMYLSQARDAGMLSGERRAFFLPIVSGSGGSGKSVVAVMAAMVAHGRGYKTLLIDLDMQFGDSNVLMGAGNAVRLDDAIAHPEMLDSLEMAEGKPALIAAPRTLETSETLASHLPELLRRAFANFEVVVANTGGFWTEQHIFLLELSTKALFLVDQRPSSLRACQHALELCERCGIAASPFVIGVNRCGKGAVYSSIDVSCALRGMPAIELRDGGSDVEECLAAGLPQALIDSQNELCVSIDRMLSGMLPQSADHASRLQASGKRRAHRLFARKSWGKEVACL